MRRWPCLSWAVFRSITLRAPVCGLAYLYNISAGGVQLLTDRPLRPGAFLRLRFPQQGPPLLQPLTLKVIYATPGGEGSWLVGGTWLRKLGKTQLHILVQRAEASP